MKGIRNNILVKPVFKSIDSILYTGKPEMIFEGTVLSVGPDVHEVKVGDYAFIDHAAGECIIHDDEVLLAVKEKDIWAISENR